MRRPYWMLGVILATIVGMVIISAKPAKYFLAGKNTENSTTENNTKIDRKFRYVESWTVLDELKNYEILRPDLSKFEHLQPSTEMEFLIGALTIDPYPNHRYKIQVFIIGGANALSWSAPVTILKICDMLLTEYRVADFHPAFVWYIIPVLNPEGMDFTQTIRWLPPVEVSNWQPLSANRRPDVWYKNLDGVTRKPTSCFGTNIDRNFPYHFLDDSSTDRCSQLYGGVAPLSSAEATALDAYIRTKRIPSAMAMFIHLDSTFDTNRESIVYPWDFTDLLYLPFEETLVKIANRAIAKSKLNFHVMQGRKYEKASGTIIDYASGIIGMDYVYRVQQYQEEFPVDTGIDYDKIETVAHLILQLVREWYDVLALYDLDSD